MLHFQKRDVYQRAIEFLTVASRIRGRLPKGNADLADQLRRASQSIPQTSPRDVDVQHGPIRRSTTRSPEALRWNVLRTSTS